MGTVQHHPLRTTNHRLPTTRTHLLLRRPRDRDHVLALREHPRQRDLPRGRRLFLAINHNGVLLPDGLEPRGELEHAREVLLGEARDEEAVVVRVELGAGFLGKGSVTRFAK